MALREGEVAMEETSVGSERYCFGKETYQVIAHTTSGRDLLVNTDKHGSKRVYEVTRMSEDGTIMARNATTIYSWAEVTKPYQPKEGETETELQPRDPGIEGALAQRLAEDVWP